LQLHGEETPERVAQVRRRWAKPVMKAIKVETAQDAAAALAYRGTADLILFGARAPKGSPLPSGNGLPFDWQALAAVKDKVAYMLSGGLTPDNVAEAIRATGARIGQHVLKRKAASATRTSPTRRGECLPRPGQRAAAADRAPPAQRRPAADPLHELQFRVRRVPLRGRCNRGETPALRLPLGARGRAGAASCPHEGGRPADAPAERALSSIRLGTL
jgi:hypothetical protein